MFKFSHLLRRRQEAREVERQAADQHRGISLGRGCDALLLQPSQNEAVNGAFDPRFIFHRGRIGLGQRQEGPVPLVRRTLFDPAPQRGDLFGRQTAPLARRRRHEHVLVVRRDALDQRAFVRLAGDNRHGQRPFACIQSQVGLAMFWVGPMAIETVRKDRPDIAVKANRLGRSGDCQARGHQAGAGQKRQDRARGREPPNCACRCTHRSGSQKIWDWLIHYGAAPPAPHIAS